MKLDELQVYQAAMQLGETVWDIVQRWDAFTRRTIGEQLVRSADSVAANVSEGYGRFFYKVNKQFCYYGRGSLYETLTWLTKAHNRRLISDEEFDSLRKEIEFLSVKLNKYLRAIGKQDPKNIGSEATILRREAPLDSNPAMPEEPVRRPAGATT